MATLEGLLCVPLVFLLVFIYCYSSTQISGNLEEVGDIVYQANWYQYPPELRKFPILIIARSQATFNFTGLNVFYCNKATFVSVSKVKHEFQDEGT